MGQLNRNEKNTQPFAAVPSVPFEESDPLPKTPPELRYHISSTTRLKDNIFRWVDFHEQNGDEAVKVYT